MKRISFGPISIFGLALIVMAIPIVMGWSHIPAIEWVSGYCVGCFVQIAIYRAGYFKSEGQEG